MKKLSVDLRGDDFEIRVITNEKGFTYLTIENPKTGDSVTLPIQYIPALLHSINGVYKAIEFI